MTTQADIIADIQALSGVTAVRLHEASGRHYINLAQGDGNADRSSKIYIQGGKVVLDWGKGNHSPIFKAAADELEAFCASRGIVSRLYASAPSWTAVIG